MVAEPQIRVRSPWVAALTLVLTCGAQFVVVIDETIVNVALPSIGTELAFGTAELAWVVDAYMLLFGGFLLLGGRCADLFGRVRMFRVGLTLFAVASLVAGLAGSPELLVVARAAQGLGAALLSPAALSILVVTFTEENARRRALGIWGGLIGVAGVSGVILGGVITEAVGWPWIFFVNVPIAIVLGGLTLLLPTGEACASTGRFNPVGATLVTSGLLLLIYTVIETSHRSWSDPVTVAGLAGAAALLVAFVAHERRTANPIVRLGLLARRPVAVANILTVLVSAGLYGMFFLLTLYMQQVHQWSPLRTGWSWAPFGVAIAVVTVLAIRLLPRIGSRSLVVGGLLLFAAGQYLLLRTTATGGYVEELLPALLLCGAGLGLALVPNTVTAVSGIAPAEAGAASGTLNTSQQVGGAVGLAVLATLATRRFASELATGTTPADAIMSGFHHAFTVMLGLTATAVLVAFLVPSVRRPVDVGAIA
ncbi:MFS transporter [Actinophytocola gossypii]|uniref:MFS transporter n=1 Tax=Actinophytocola gossypii TaxID=2812003 RepID=A0ABT2J7B3_9PSEU|nr:MFS transporter [Actinophytocola gossypii]MCT2583666.1 MFS transporter [Actinophytocola gossypii]